ncbi:hypothetical protein TTRE_0000270901 [Trichuris trichiura]|uniref:Proton-coupled folate transporter n=1 Tax=Trichuris trichiura TaxID=36087 RepID=A0A077Z3L4_TRITR|nr:hypothetical protein TTRE_0000270901 [Trichuris trichiura]
MYMFTSFVHISIFQALIYEKASLRVSKSLNGSSINISDTEIRLRTQTLANHTYLYSTLCLLFPSLLIAGIYGSLSDLKYKKKTLVLPFFGLLLADVNYIVQAYFLEFNIYLLLISDLVFGVFGGYTAILGSIFSYSARHSDRKKNSYRIATMEACLGFGGTLGFVLAGILHRSLSFWAIFALNLVLHSLVLAYMLIRVSGNPPTSSESPANIEPPINAYGACLGAQHIMFFYLKHRYDIFFGFRLIVTVFSFCQVLIIYPTLRRRGVTDLMLALCGIVSRSIGCLVLGLVCPALNSARLQLCLSVYILGKLFAILAMLESVIGLLASLSFNLLFPQTLSFFSGFSYLLISCLFLVPFTCILLTRRLIRRRHSRT